MQVGARKCEGEGHRMQYGAVRFISEKHLWGLQARCAFRQGAQQNLISTVIVEESFVAKLQAKTVWVLHLDILVLYVLEESVVSHLRKAS